MKKISLLLVASICVTLLGCGKTENAEATAVSGISIEPIENISESETLTETDTTDNHFTEALDDEGTYWLSGYLRASDKDSAGQPDEYGVLQAIIYDTSIEDMNDVDEAAFIITDQTVFQMIGGEDGPENVTKEDFAQYLKDCADSGLLLDIQVNGAQVVVAQICS